MKLNIKGNFRRYIYKSDDNYIIGLFKVREVSNNSLDEYLNKTITFTGYFHELNEDDTYLFYGEFINHPRYGIQFKVSEYERVKPEDKDTLIAFLASGLFKGIGEKTAIKIVEVLGNDCLEIILNDYHKLLTVPGITEKIAVKIYNSLLAYEESHTIMVYLFELGFNAKDALLIYNYYKDNTKKICEENIYQIVNDINNINFDKVDKLRNQLGISANDTRRIKAGIEYVMNELCNQYGHTYLSAEEIITNTIRCLHTNIDYEQISECLSSLAEEKRIIIDNNRYFLSLFYHAELNIANFLSYLSSHINKDLKQMNNYLTKLETYFSLQYNDKQKEAIKKSIINDLLIITGGPGTGKTTIIKGIVELYKEMNKLSYDKLVEEIVLLAPTGRAAKRVSEATLLPATTIHRFLKWNKETNSFGVNEHNKAYVKFVIIDEVSMIDTLLFDSLIKGLPKNIKLILVGDFNQLPSIGTGQILKDVIESEVLDVIFLETLYRQNENSAIISLAHDIKNGETAFEYLYETDEYKLIECSPSDIKNNIKKICEEKLTKKLDYKEIQILAPIYKGENGIDNLNKLLQAVFNPSSKNKNELIVGEVTYREHDKILQLVNMIDENVFNGDIGIIDKIVNNDKKEIYINFDGNIIKYTPSDFINIKHGYAISIHKSQGSEFDTVIMPMANAYSRMLYRKLIYTGVTRAKKKLYIIGEKGAFIKGIMNNETNIRKTILKELLGAINLE